ncbi:hypothetical protein Q361_102210 [Flavobacterium croceum DSM 17960]|uniref:Uncharacterized protein n=1 Tax=Flavobacterium croceum DSM 17960 TaxID=1121886 RepID=A0A2S4NB09_9FLAO|nr:hypothetical protein [Flavobacterium croceum]POS02896.1 hypothetical protein Q361_102210 [Flavobacterium croceum DSM 17960]
MSNKNIWEDISNELNKRNEVLDEMLKKNDANSFLKEKSLIYSVTEVFVEKAQEKLTKRANVLKRYTIVSVLLTIILILLFLFYLIFKDYIEHYIYEVLYEKCDYFTYTKEKNEINAYTFTLQVLKLLSIGGLFGGLIYYLSRFSFIFYKEMTSLYNTRHDLRFGRLYIYLSKKDEFELKELVDAFHWSRNDLTNENGLELNSPINTMTDGIEKIIKASAELVKNAK